MSMNIPNQHYRIPHPNYKPFAPPTNSAPSNSKFYK